VIDNPESPSMVRGAGTGAALAGLKPVVEFMTSTSPCRRSTTSSSRRPKDAYMSGGQRAARLVSRSRMALARASGAPQE